MRSENRPLVVGPLPPPVGGIATIVEKLRAWPGVADELQFLDTGKKGSGLWARVSRPLTLLMALNRRLYSRPSAVLVFSSAHGSFWEKGFWLMLSRLYRVPMAVMMVDGNFPRFYEDLPAPLRGLARRLLERFSTVIVQTESWQRFYSGIAPRGNYQVLPNGVDCEEFRPAASAARDVPVLLFVGWLIPEKGVFDLLEAARVLKSRHLRFTIKLVGPFHGYEAALRTRIADVDLHECVEVVGVVRSRAQIIELYQSADAFVLPSWAEGLPVAMLEAMACGLAVVGSKVGGIPDLVEDDVCGLLVPPRDPAALAVALERLVTDSALRATFGRAARARVESRFSNEVFIRGVLALLRD